MHDHDFDPDGTRLPVKIDGTSNGEFQPYRLNRMQKAACTLAQEIADTAHTRLGLSRRRFMTSASGVAASLVGLNAAYAAHGHRGGGFDIPEDALFEPTLADHHAGGDEFIFDVQTHCVDPSGDWATGKDGKIWEAALSRAFGQRLKCAAGSYDCYSAHQLAKEVYLDSDTDVAVISALWGAQDSNPTPIDYASEAREVIKAVGNGALALIHGGVLPNEAGAVDRMEEMATTYGVSAWKLYPQWGPDGTGFFFGQSDAGDRFLAEARRLGVTTICAHKGVPLYGLDYAYSDPKDMGPVAAANPDLNFIIYHSGFEPGVAEGPYNPGNPRGVDRLIKSFEDAGFTPGTGNLYAEMGSLWRYFMSRGDEAAHVIGKLVKHMGATRLCWGTDSIWYGSPADQIQAFRTFQISDAFAEIYGYPKLTPAMKAQIFGLNAAPLYDLDVDAIVAKRTAGIGAKRAEYRAEGYNPSFETFGPKTRRQFFANLKAHGGRPG